MRKTTIPLFFVLLLLGGLTACKTDEAPEVGPTPVAAEDMALVPDGYELVWNDEFDYEGLPDSNRWSYQTGGHGWTSRELQLYTKADPDNVKVANGQLQITALVEKTARNEFTSTRLVTKNKAEFEQGYFEVRAKFPTGEGLRSTFWMVGDTVSKIGWPTAGEIDVVEHYGVLPTVVGSAVQTPDFFWSGKGQKGGSRIVKTATTDFHVYSCLWTDELLTFAVDGETSWTYAPLPGRGKAGWPFNWPFYMILNLSVGGERGPKTKNLSPDIFPASMMVDYVRVYQK